MTAPALLFVLHWVSGFVVLAYGLHHLEVLSPCRRDIDWKTRVALLSEGAAWILLSIGAGGAVITPLLPYELERPTLQDACTMIGIAAIMAIHHRRRRLR